MSDWSSDVCSSDLLPRHARRHLADVGLLLDAPQYGLHQPVQLQPPAYHLRCLWRPMAFRHRLLSAVQELQSRGFPLAAPAPQARCGPPNRLTRQSSTEKAAESSKRVPGWRSEEHTSELQSLMRISYAVFCLKKKKR